MPIIYRKERSKLIFENTSNKITYTLDVIDGKMRSSRSGVLKVWPPVVREFIYSEAKKRNCPDVALFQSIQFIFNNCSINGELFEKIADWIEFIEKYANVGLVLLVSPYHWNETHRKILTEAKLNKDFCDYFGQQHCSRVVPSDIIHYYTYKKIPEKLYEDFHRVFQVSKNTVINVFLDYAQQNPKIMDWILWIEEHRHISRIAGRSWWTMLRSYMNGLGDLEEDFVFTRDFLNDYCRVMYLCEQQKDVIFTKNLIKNQPDWLFFEDENFTVVIPRTREAFHDEATQQHNCVENFYLEKVAKGELFITFIRRKDNIDKSVVTCEIKRDLQIYQYKKAYNTSVDADSDESKFKVKYQNYLDSLPRL